MSELMIDRNFAAYSAIKEGECIAFKAAGSNGSPSTVEPATKSSTHILGVAVKPAAADDMVTFLPLVPGKIVNVLVAGDVTAGAQLTLGSSGLVVSAAANLKVPLVAIEAASSGSLCRAMMVCLGETVPSPAPAAG